MDADERPTGDPRDPRGDLRRAQRGHPQRRLPRWSLALLGLLVLGPVLNHRELLLADPGMTLGALGFAAAVCAPLVAGVLWADRRWPAGRRHTDSDG